MTILYIYSALFSLPKRASCVNVCARMMCFGQLSLFSVSIHCPGQGLEDHLTTVLLISPLKLLLIHNTVVLQTSL